RGRERPDMYLLDTEVIWALRSHEAGHAQDQLFEWAAEQMPSTLFASAISMMEFESGTRLLERKDKASAAAIHKWIDTRLRPAFAGRIIAIEDAIVRSWSHLGYSEFRDGIVAATALEHGLVLATREVANFRAGKLKTV